MVAKTGEVDWLVPFDQDEEEKAAEEQPAEEAAAEQPAAGAAEEQQGEEAEGEQEAAGAAQPPPNDEAAEAAHERRRRKKKIVDMKEHCKYGHQEFVPYCPGCAQGAAKKRSHWRLDPDTRPGGTLALDLSGPHVLGRGFGMPSSTGYKYFLCGVYQPPASADGKAKAPWPYVRWLKSKAGPEVLKAVQVIIAAINATHVQKAVFRIHSDRGGEFINIGLTQWAAEQGIQPTSTEGHDPSGNGQAEAWIGKLKTKSQVNAGNSEDGHFAVDIRSVTRSTDIKSQSSAEGLG